VPGQFQDLPHPEAGQCALLVHPLELGMVAADPELQLGHRVDQDSIVSRIVGPLPVREVLLQGFFRRALGVPPGGRISHQPLDVSGVRLAITGAGWPQLITQPHRGPAVPGQAGDAHRPAHRDLQRPGIELIQSLPDKREDMIGGRHLRDCSDPGP